MEHHTVATPAKQLPTPATALEQLHAARASLTGELADLIRTASRLNEAATSEAAVLAELTALSDQDTAAMKRWASAGCVGSPPEPDAKQRRALGERLSSAQAASSAAKAAGQDIDQQIASLNEHAKQIRNQIEQAIFDHVGREHDAVAAEYREVCERASRLAAKIAGLAMHYRDAGLLQQASVISATKLPNPGTNRLEIMAAAEVWGRRIADLRRGAGQ